METNEIKDRVFTVSEAGAAYPAMGERYLRRLIFERRIPYLKDRRRVFLRQSDIEDYLSGIRVEVP
jgi:excisionase family DNA binding protein